MKLIMVRHGETEINKNKMIQGRSDYPLNDQGIKDALNAASVLVKNIKKIDVFVSSPSQRALLTTQLIAGKYFHDNLVISDPYFYERDFGPYEGRLISDVFPITIDLPGYETDHELQTRVYQGVVNLYKKHHDKTVLVGCHSHTIKAVLTKFASHQYNFQSRLINGSVFIFEVNEDNIVLREVLNNY